MPRTVVTQATFAATSPSPPGTLQGGRALGQSVLPPSSSKPPPVLSPRNYADLGRRQRAALFGPQTSGLVTMGPHLGPSRAVTPARAEELTGAECWRYRGLCQCWCPGLAQTHCVWARLRAEPLYHLRMTPPCPPGHRCLIQASPFLSQPPLPPALVHPPRNGQGLLPSLPSCLPALWLPKPSGGR